MKKGSKILPTGKLPHDVLHKFIDRYTAKSEEVVVGAQIGEDAAVIDIGDKYLLAKTDPITFVTDEIGYYAININANDIACMGGIPKWFLATILLPEGKTTEKIADSIFSQLSDACKQLDVVFCGGHTEITQGIDKPIVVGHMLGEVEKDKLVTSGQAQVGDDVILTKGIAIEATSIIARESAEKLASLFSSELVEQCKNYIYDPGISVFKEARLAVSFEHIHAMHDPTEGGLATGLIELAKAANVGLRVEQDMIEVLPECKLLCDVFDLDPMGLIASGSLLIVCQPSVSPLLLEKFEEHNVYAGRIGKIMPPDFGYKMISFDGEEWELSCYSQDEIIKYFKKLEKEK